MRGPEASEKRSAYHSLGVGVRDVGILQTRAEYQNAQYWVYILLPFACSDTCRTIVARPQTAIILCDVQSLKVPEYAS